MRRILTFLLLVFLQVLSRLFYRVDLRFIGEPLPGDPWAGLRLVAILNHTSLFEPVFVGGVPSRFLWRVAAHGVIPVAEKTLRRPLAGRFFRFLAPHVVPLSRSRDHTWKELLGKVDDAQSMLIILPEGRMMRRGGLDGEGQPMTVRGGIADVLRAIPQGRMLLAYSGGLHHIQAPGEGLPRLFRTARIRVEVLDLAAYRESLMPADRDTREFRLAVVRDLERRRDQLCPVEPESTSGPFRPAATPAPPPGEPPAPADGPPPEGTRRTADRR